MASLQDKVAIITGASAGLGAEFARHFAQEGAKLVLTGRDAARLEHVAQECVDRGLDRSNILTIAGDITEDDVAKNLITKSVSHFGQIDILINNAGVFQLSGLDTNMATFDKIMDINLRTVFQITKEAAPELKKSKGNIVNISSCASLCSVPIAIAYAVSKRGLDHFTRCTAAELGPFGVRVNTVNPGTIPTDIFENSGMSPEDVHHLLDSTPQIHALGRNGRPEDVAKVVAFLASDAASFMTGAIVPVDGGASIFTSSHDQRDLVR